MLAKFVEKLLELQQVQTFQIDGHTYATKELKQVEPLVCRPKIFKVRSLDGIVKMVRNEIPKIRMFPVFINIETPTTVSVNTTYDRDMARDYLYTAVCDVPGFRAGFREPEDAIIALRSLYIPNEGVEYVLDLLSRITKNNGINLTDNGVTQTVEAQKGVALKTTEVVKPRVKLRPFRTFLEVTQPESEFLLRVNDEGQIGLFEADGGVWELEAKKYIEEYFNKELSDLIEAGNVVVLR